MDQRMEQGRMGGFGQDGSMLSGIQEPRFEARDGTPEPKPLRGETMHIDFDDFETPRAEMFGDTKSPAFTVNGKVVGANSVCVRQLWDVDYVEFAISHSRQLLLLVPCSEFVVQGYKWAKEKDGKRYATTRTGVPFVLSICQMMGWDPNQRHRIPGKLINSQGLEMMSFDLTAAKHFDKPSGQKGSRSQVIFTGEWDGHFGPKFSEGRRTLQVNKFDQLTVWSIKEGNTEQAFVLPEESKTAEKTASADQVQQPLTRPSEAQPAGDQTQMTFDSANGTEAADNAGGNGGFA